MKIKPRHFPHPVLSSFSDDYVNTEFSADSSEGIEGNNYVFEVTYTLDNNDLQCLIDKGDAKYLVHLECDNTWFKHAEKTKEKHVRVEIPSWKLSNNVDMCTFIIAEKEINNYSNKDMHHDFKDDSFHVYPGDILAIGPSMKLNIEKMPIENINSIFQLQKNERMKDGEISVDVSGHKIVVSISPYTHSIYNQLTHDRKILPLFHSMIAIPAIVVALNDISKNINNAEDRDDLADLIWYKSLEKRMEYLGYDIEQSGHLENPVKMASEILDYPFYKAVKGLENLAGIE